MDCMCLAAPVSVFLRRRRYQRLSEVVVSGDDSKEEEEEERQLVRVVAGEEKMEFLVDPLVLKQNPFRILMETLMKKTRGEGGGGIEYLIRKQRVIFMDVDSILIEHMLWLIKNDSPSFLKLNLTEIVDFYALDPS